jgi:perosamine synthetase
MKSPHAMHSNAVEQLCLALTATFGSPRAFVFAKGRVGLYAGLRAMELPKNATVCLPGYTCMVVPSAVQFAGLKPVYVDIDPRTYNIRPELLNDIESPAAAIVQHTYGIPCDMAAVEAWAARKNVPIIEDCCHTLGTTINGRLCGTFGRFAFMSGQWNKPFSTGLGGMLLVNDSGLAEKVQQIVDRELKQPGPMANIVLRLQIAVYDMLVRPSTAMLMTFAYRAANYLGLAKGSSSNEELRGDMPADYFTGMAPCQIARGLREMACVAENIEHRRALTAFYQTELPKVGFAALDVPEAAETPLLRYPVRVANKSAVLRQAVRNGVEIGSWFECPLHPLGTKQEDFGYSDGICPESERAAREVVNLPTHRKVDRRTAERVLEFLRRVAEPVK